MFLNLPAIEVRQPFGSFFITKITAGDLLSISFSDTYRVISEEGNFAGSQRELKDSRLRDIAKYIDSSECAFPNSIILAANYNTDGQIVEDEEIRWNIQISEDGCSRILIPTNLILSSIIDGQHRLNGFRYTTEIDRLKTELLCAVYFDLPNPYQAFLFATINSNQRKVDRNLAYQLFGYNLDDEQSESWTPDKLGVYLTRKLNLSSDSPFYNHILVAAQNDYMLYHTDPRQQLWRISTATVVDGLLSLYSKKPKNDRDLMLKYKVNGGRDRKLLVDDGTPLRVFFTSYNDIFIYKVVFNYFASAESILFRRASPNSYIFKTVGVQALFDVLRQILPLSLKNKDISADFFSQFHSKVDKIDFSNNFFQASGIGRSRIRTIMLGSH